MVNIATLLENAACKGMDTEIWFVESGGSKALDKARKICDACPVEQMCLEFAITRGVNFGMFGGKTVNERISYRINHGLTITHSTRIYEPHGSEAAVRRHDRRREPYCEKCRQYCRDKRARG